MTPDGAPRGAVVLVDTEPNGSEQLARLLTDAGYGVTCTVDPLACLGLCETGRVDLVITEMVVGPVTGLDLCRLLRAVSDIPLIVCSRSSAEVDKVLALEMGADDYITRPYSERELLLRVAAVLRRRHRPQPKLLEVPTDLGQLVLHPVGVAVELAGRRVSLSPLEFRLVSALARAGGRLLTRAQLQWAVWERQLPPGDKLLDVYVRRLRTKVDPVPGASLIITVRRQGYRLASSGTTPAAAAAAPGGHARVRSLPDER
ncbi:MAG: regX3 [Frankiales bacterium]|jgi:two-component system response regulator RegX3|nr:regX3 [Frankiales bacterium]